MRLHCVHVFMLMQCVDDVRADTRVSGVHVSGRHRRVRFVDRHCTDCKRTICPRSSAFHDPSAAARKRLRLCARNHLQRHGSNRQNDAHRVFHFCSRDRGIAEN